MSGPPRLSDDLDALLGRVARGDSAAFATLYDLTKTRVYGLVMRILRDPGYSEETTQEVYLEVWRTVAADDPGNRAARQWAGARARADQAGSRRESRYGAVNAESASASAHDPVAESAVVGDERR